MSFDFELSPVVVEWREGIRALVDEVAIPLEQAAFAHGVHDALRLELQAEARKRDVWAPQLPKELGGGGLSFTDIAVLLEEAGRSLLGALAINAAAPDEGNLHLLNKIASPRQRDRYLIPLASGEVRSCFAMTEPSPGAGSDPSLLTTTCTPRSDGTWHITGRKHLITGADGASFCIVMSAGGRDDQTGATMFVLDMDTPGIQLGSHARTIDTTMVGGHCQLDFDVVVGPDAVLGEPGEGFRYAQTRLAPARLTHCMRWLGAAQRAHEIAVRRAAGRPLFGSPLTELGMAQALIAENEVDLAAARSLLWHAAWRVQRGENAGQASSQAKVFISEATGRVVDRAVQLAGGLGTSEELVIGRIYADIRAFRIYDGATEVHKMSLARRAVRRIAADA